MTEEERIIRNKKQSEYFKNNKDKQWYANKLKYGKAYNKEYMKKNIVRYHGCLNSKVDKDIINFIDNNFERSSTSIVLSINKNTDGDIIDYLKDKDNKNAYFKELIRSEIRQTYKGKKYDSFSGLLKSLIREDIELNSNNEDIYDDYDFYEDDDYLE